MKAKFLKRLLITFSIVISASLGILFACAGGDWDWFGYSNFTPETFVDKSYSPLFYSANEMFYGIGHDEEYITRFNDEIKNDWTTYLENKLNQNQVNYFLLNDSSTADIEGLYQFISKNAKNESFNKWNGKINLTDQKVKDFIEFIYFARQVEKSSINTYDPWDYENAPKPPKVDATLISQIQKKYQTSTNPFIKDRYWFQTVKAFFYSNSKPETITFFEKTKNEVPKNTLYYRALAYIAGVYYKDHNYAQSNYLNSIVFDKCLPLRVVTAYNFHPQEENDWKTALDLAKTNDEKAALWALLGYYADPARAINEIFKINPQNPHIDYLLTRLVNLEEENLRIEINESALKYKTELKNKLNQEAISVVNSIAQSEKTAKPYLWNMAAGYLQTLNGNYSLAKSYLAKAEKQIPQTQSVKNQLRLLHLINTLSEMDVMNSTNENILLPELDWLYSQSTDGTTGDIRCSAAIAWSKRYVSALYAAKNNVVFAELFNQNNVFYQNSTQLEAMKSFLLKENKTPFEKLAESIYSINLSDIFEYQAIMYTFENKIDLAFESMGKAGELKDQLLLGNPFNGKIQDCHDCDHLAAQKTKYSKLRFIEIIQIMQSKVAKGEDVFNNYLLLANSFYNISYYGNARFFYTTKIIDSYDKYYETIINNVEQAKSYYKKAFEAATNDEQRAKCTYMLAKCERNEYYTTNSGNSDWNNPPADYLAWDGFVTLKTQYSATKFYKDVIAECGYFKKYVGVK